MLRVVVARKRRDIGLGGYPDVTLQQARDKAREMREQIQQGVDLVEERRANRVTLTASQLASITFEEAARRYLAAKTHEFRNAKHTAQ
jgi:hypothetical protein